MTKVKDWRIRTKSRIIQSMGGECHICGYSRYDGALELHHLDPNQKKFSFASIRANPKSWGTIVEELRKCVLLCSNCHKEVEAGIQSVPIKIYFNEQYSDPSFFDRSLRGYREKKCTECGLSYTPTSGNQKYCSKCCLVV